jgi:hypothetical protein
VEKVLEKQVTGFKHIITIINYMLKLFQILNEGHDPMLILGHGGLGYRPSRSIIGRGGDNYEEESDYMTSEDERDEGNGGGGPRRPERTYSVQADVDSASEVSSDEEEREYETESEEEIEATWDRKINEAYNHEVDMLIDSAIETGMDKETYNKSYVNLINKYNNIAINEIEKIKKELISKRLAEMEELKKRYPAKAFTDPKHYMYDILKEQFDDDKIIKQVNKTAEYLLSKYQRNNERYIPEVYDYKPEPIKLSKKEIKAIKKFKYIHPEDIDKHTDPELYKEYEEWKNIVKKIEDATTEEINTDQLVNRISSEVEDIKNKINDNRGVAFEYWVINNSSKIFEAINELRTQYNKDPIPISDIVQYSSLDDTICNKSTRLFSSAKRRNLTVGETLPIDLYSRSSVFECKYFINNSDDTISIQTSKLVGGRDTSVYYINVGGQYKYYGTYSTVVGANGWIKPNNKSISNKGQNYYLLVMLPDGLYTGQLSFQPTKNSEDFYWTRDDFPTADKPLKSGIFPTLYKMRLYEKNGVGSKYNLSEKEIYKSSDSPGTVQRTIDIKVKNLKKLNIKI